MYNTNILKILVKKYSIRWQLSSPVIDSDSAKNYQKSHIESDSSIEKLILFLNNEITSHFQ